MNVYHKGTETVTKYIELLCKYLLHVMQLVIVKTELNNDSYETAEHSWTDWHNDDI